MNTVHKLTEAQFKSVISKMVKEEVDNFLSNNRNNQYNGYVIISDADQALLGNYDNLEDAVYDSKSMAEADPYGSYRVCGVDNNNQYDYDETCVFSTYNEGKERLGMYIKENIKDLLKEAFSK